MTALTGGALLALALVLGGCTPEPAPQPTPTSPFTSEEEAFAAAEATYRAYVDAVNERRADAGAPDPQQYLLGQALESDIDTQRQLDQAGITVVGPSRVVNFSATSTSAGFTEVQASACLDASESRAIDSAGEDVTPPGRDPTTVLDLTFDLAGDQLVITSSTVSKDQSC